MDLSLYPTLRVAASDLNGQMRGKRMPANYGTKVDRGAIRMPLSSLNVDIWGADIEDSPLVFESGDVDGILFPSDRGPVPMPWLDMPSALVPLTMFTAEGAPYMGDPRQVLTSVLDRYKARGWEVQAATEMEFSLVDPKGKQLKPPRDPRTRQRLFGPDILSVDELDAFDVFFTELYDGCLAMDLPVQSMINEAGIGQFEVTLSHQTAMSAADDAWLFKFLVRGLARKHGMAATFMAKPYQDDAGNGMHVHFSVLDENGQNIFNNGGPEGTPRLLQAVAGCVQAMPASTLIFAPHGPSYDRLVPSAHAPTGACWAYENRTAAIRIPGGPPQARRIEHRVAGGDINPYLLLSCILGAAIEGIENELTPPEPITGNAYELDLPQLAPSWKAAIDLFETDPFIHRCLPPRLIKNMVMTKRQERRKLAELPRRDHWKLYLERV